MTDQETVITVVRQQVAGMIAGDLATLRQLISLQARFVHLTGAVQSRDEWLHQLELGRLHYFTSRERAVHARVGTDQATVTLKSELDVRIYGFRNRWPLTTQTTLARVGGQWLITGAKTSMN